MLTYEELSAWWHVPMGTIYSWVSREQIPFVRLADRSVRFEREVLDAWLARRRTLPSTPRARRGGLVIGRADDERTCFAHALGVPEGRLSSVADSRPSVVDDPDA